MASFRKWAITALPRWGLALSSINIRRVASGSSRKHANIILTPLNPTFIVKPGFTGVVIIFHISAQNIDCGYSLEPPR